LLNRLLACSPDLARPLMDATTEAMRLASEQQLSPDCLAGVGSCERRHGPNSPSLESLMTLLWAIRVFEKNRHRVPELDTATEATQSGALGDLLRAREVAGKGVSFRSSEREPGQKSLDDWGLAFRHNHP
jgi:transcriptional activator HAC1